MKEDLHSHRKIYEKGALNISDLDPNPMQQFRSWYYEVQESEGVEEANTMTLTTLGTDGYPKGRVVLLKKYDAYGFYFYTNYTSEKGQAIAAHNKVGLSFFWPVHERQVIIKGIARKTSESDSENYFHSRPRGSQLGALLSQQSAPIADRESLEKKLKDLEERYRDSIIPMPESWGGYLVEPYSIEFWQGRPNRLHDRILYERATTDWNIKRLQP